MGRRLLAAAPVPEQFLAVAPARDPDGEHGPDAAGVELVLERPGLEGVRVAGHQRSREEAERHLRLLAQAHDPRPVLGVARVVLLAVALAGLRARRHDHARLRAVDTRLERPRGGARLAILV